MARLAPGSYLGPFEILAEAGAGGFSTVYRARRGEERYALKVPQVDSVLDHLRAEAALAAQIDDEQVPAVLEAHLDADPPHLVMPWIEGAPPSIPAEAPGPEGLLRALTCVRAIATVVARLHGAGIVHGDLKPGNILIARDGRAYVLDLGLARSHLAVRRERTLAQSLVSVDGRSIAGTLDYLAPEMLEGADPTPASDVYSLGVLLHQLLTGRSPAFGMAPGALNPWLTPAIERALGAALASSPKHRIPDAQALLVRLDDLIAAERRTLARRNGHARRRVFQERLATLQRGVHGARIPVFALIVSIFLLGLPVFGGAFVSGVAGYAGSGPLVVLLAVALALVSIAGMLVLPFVAFLLAVTTINAWILGVPSREYKERRGHPIWSFMMQ